MTIKLFPITRPLGYERVYLPLHKVADTPFHIQGDVLSSGGQCHLIHLAILMLQKTATSLTHMYKTYKTYFTVSYMCIQYQACVHMYIYEYCSEFSKYLLAILLLSFLFFRI